MLFVHVCGACVVPTCDKIVGRAGAAHQVHADGRKESGAAALQQQNLVVVRHVAALRELNAITLVYQQSCN